MRKSKIPQPIINAIRRRAAAAEKYFIADNQITEYCVLHGIDTEYINGNVETVTRFDPEFFIRDLEACIDKKAQKE